MPLIVIVILKPKVPLIPCKQPHMLPFPGCFESYSCFIFLTFLSFKNFYFSFQSCFIYLFWLIFTFLPWQCFMLIWPFAVLFMPSLTWAIPILLTQWHQSVFNLCLWRFNACDFKSHPNCLPPRPLIRKVWILERVDYPWTNRWELFIVMQTNLN